MSVAQHFKSAYAAFRTSETNSGQYIADPGSGLAFDLRGVDNGFAEIASGTRVLPDNIPRGVRFTVYATGNVTLTNVLGTTVATLATGEYAECRPLSNTTWGASAGTVGAIEINTAADVPIADAGGYTGQSNVETVTQALLRETVIRVPMTSFVDADGDPLAKFADNASPNPGFNLANSKAFGIRWNNNATQGQPVLTSVVLPIGPDALAVTMHVIASKTGATVGDATTFTVTAFENAEDNLHDASADLGGTTSAMVGDATAKNVQHVTLDLSELLGDKPSALTFTITPTSGTLGTDDVIIEGIYFSTIVN